MIQIKRKIYAYACVNTVVLLVMLFLFSIEKYVYAGIIKGTATDLHMHMRVKLIR